jgi:hypothetical protein
MRRRVSKSSASLFAIAILLGATIPGVGSASPSEVKMQALLNADGSGRLFVNTPLDLYGTTWSWEACRPDLSGCEPFATGGDITTGNAVPDTVFRVSGGGAAGSSPIWHGNLAQVVAPSILGAVRANELVVPVSASWRGGWDGDFDQTQLAACATRTGKRCISLTDPNYSRSCREGGTVLDPKFTGKYLRVADMRFGAGTLFTRKRKAAASPYGHPIWQANGQTATAVVGRIRRAVGPRRITCGPPPLFQASLSKKGVATITCGPLACRAVLIARRGQRTARAIQRLPRLRGRAAGFRRRTALRISPQGLSHLGSGRIRMVVRINGERVASRTVSSSQAGG